VINCSGSAAPPLRRSAARVGDIAQRAPRYIDDAVPLFMIPDSSGFPVVNTNYTIALLASSATLLDAI